MIKIIKDGKPQKFTTKCQDCGCEFEYELEDIKTDFGICLTTYPCQYNTYVICPCCGNYIHHGTVPEKAVLVGIDRTENKTEIEDKPSKTESNPCEACHNRFDQVDGLGNPIVGDSPCQWCSHYKYKITCSILGDSHESKN